MTVPMPMLGSGPYGTSPRGRSITSIDSKDVEAGVRNMNNNSQEHVATADRFGWFSRQYRKMHLRRDKAT